MEYLFASSSLPLGGNLPERAQAYKGTERRNEDLEFKGKSSLSF
jgi:hypothetical protein